MPNEGSGKVGTFAAMFEKGGSVKNINTEDTEDPGLSKTLSEEQEESAFTIPGLQDEIEGLQDDELDTSMMEEPEPDFGSVAAPPADEVKAVDEAPPRRAPEKNEEGSKKSKREGHKANGQEQKKEGADMNSPDSLPEKMMSELAFSSADSRDVSPGVIQGLVQIMSTGVADKRKKATIAMCNLCCESMVNRANAGQYGAVPVLIEMMQDSNPDQHLQRLATACICNLSADPPLKDAIAQGGAIPHLSSLLDSEDDTIDARAATAHAAATLWSLCVDMEHIKPLVAEEPTLRALMRLLDSPESFVRGQACGCVGEVCIGNKKIKGQLSEYGVIPKLITLLEEPEPSTQRLAASALCNLSANHESNKKLSRQCGLIDALIKMLKETEDEAVQSAAAGGLYNLVSAADREKMEQSGVIEIMRQVPISRNINVRLGIKSKKSAQPQS